MEFTLAEEIFLAQRHGRNWAPLSHRDLASMPARVKRHIMEFRAKELGPRFFEFRAMINASMSVSVAEPVSTATINAGDLF